MTELETWEVNNNAYLGAALEWVRLRLSRLAHQVRPVAPSSPLPVVRQTDEPEEERSRWNLFRRSSDERPEPTKPRLQLPAAELGDQDFVLERADGQRQRVVGHGEQPAGDFGDHGEKGRGLRDESRGPNGASAYRIARSWRQRP